MASGQSGDRGVAATPPVGLERRSDCAIARDLSTEASPVQDPLRIRTSATTTLVQVSST